MNRSKLKNILLGILLFAVVLLFTTYYKYPWHPDHYTLGQYTYDLIEKGHASWVLHPFSLFGYYPLSIPSGFEFFFGVLYNLTAIDLPILFYFFSTFFALIAIGGVFLLMKEFTSFETSFLTAFILGTSVYFVKNVSNTASSRMFNIIFYPLFILALFRIYKIYEHDRKISLKYILFLVILFLFMNLIHRLGQLLFIFIIAFILSLLVTNFGKIVKWIKTKRIYDFRKEAYNRSKLYLYIDLEVLLILYFSFSLIRIGIIWINLSFIILIYYFWFNLHKNDRIEKLLFVDMLAYIGLFLIAKLIDLIIRGRLLVNLTRLLQEHSFQLSLIGIIAALILPVVVYFIIKHLRNMNKLLEVSIDRVMHLINDEPKKLLSWALLFVMFLYITKNFTGDNFYNFGLEHYTESFILKGDSPWVIMVNFIFSLNNNVTILIYFAFIGMIYLFLKNEKSFYDYFFIFIAIGFSQFLLDWEYIRLYMLPIYAIFMALGITVVVAFISAKMNKRLIYSILLILFILHLIISNVFIQREILLEKFGFINYDDSLPEKYSIESGRYLKDKGDVSIQGSGFKVEHKSAFYSKKVESVLAENVFQEGRDYEISSITLSELWDSFWRGKKITGFYRLADPIYGGKYYVGRYTYNLNKRRISDPTVNKIMSFYNIKYIIDGKYVKIKTNFFNSAQPLKNKIYSSGELGIYDLNKGR